MAGSNHDTRDARDDAAQVRLQTGILAAVNASAQALQAIKTSISKGGAGGPSGGVGRKAKTVEDVMSADWKKRQKEAERLGKLQESLRKKDEKAKIAYQKHVEREAKQAQRDAVARQTMVNTGISAFTSVLGTVKSLFGVYKETRDWLNKSKGDSNLARSYGTRERPGATRSFIDSANAKDQKIGWGEGTSLDFFTRMQDQLKLTSAQAEHMTNRFQALAQSGHMSVNGAKTMADGFIDIEKHFMKFGKNARISGQEILEAFSGDENVKQAVRTRMKMEGKGSFSADEATAMILKMMDRNINPDFMPKTVKGAEADKVNAIPIEDRISKSLASVLNSAPSEVGKAMGMLSTFALNLGNRFTGQEGAAGAIQRQANQYRGQFLSDISAAMGSDKSSDVKAKEVEQIKALYDAQIRGLEAQGYNAQTGMVETNIGHLAEIMNRTISEVTKKPPQNVSTTVNVTVAQGDGDAETGRNIGNAAADALRAAMLAAARGGS